MNDVEFVKKCKELVADYTNQRIDKTSNVRVVPSGIYVVWQVKALQNSKALLSTVLPDGMYYEVTFNGDKNQIYLDAYKKFENVEINL